MKREDFKYRAEENCNLATIVWRLETRLLTKLGNDELDNLYYLLYCFNSCTSLLFKTLKFQTKTLKIRPYIFQSPLKV